MDYKEFNTVAQEQGWSETTQVNLLLRFIAAHKLDADFETFINQTVDGETTINEEGEVVDPDKDILCPECGHKFTPSDDLFLQICPQCGSEVECGQVPLELRY